MASIFLFSCFRDGQQHKKKKKKKDLKNQILHEAEDGVSPETCLLSTSEELVKSDNRIKKEKHPSTKKEKKLLKKQSLIKNHSKDSTGESICKKETDKINEQTQQIEKVNINGNSNEEIYCLEEPGGSRKSLYDDQLYNTIPAIENGSMENLKIGTNIKEKLLSSNSLDPSEVPNVQSSISRSTVFHNSSELINQILQNEQAEFRKKEEAKIVKIKENYENIIQSLKTEHQTALEQVHASFERELLEKVQQVREENEKTLAKCKNEANDTITALTEQVTKEKKNALEEFERKEKELEEQFKTKSCRLNEALKHVKEREQAWQDEKGDILDEVQRLKAEATKMVKILAMEYEEGEEDLNEDKKRSLSQEVYSLQLVVEMKTGEVRSLREQLIRASQHLEETQKENEKLGRMIARVEDLEEQLRLKNQLEKKLSIEKSELEDNMNKRNIEALRMSQNVEELQWRIKNNYELPIQMFPAKSYSEEVDSRIVEKSESLNIGSQCHRTSTPTNVHKSDPWQRKQSFFTVSEEMVSATTSKEECFDKICENEFKSDFSMTTVNQGSLKSPLHNYQNQSDDDGIDGDSLDEGLGDISSEGESYENPTTITKEVKVKKNIESSDTECVTEAGKSITREDLELKEAIQSSKSEVERLPSRISFEFTN